MAAEKKWGNRPFWGVSYEYDPQWILNEDQKLLQVQLIDICRTVIRPEAIVADREYKFPKKSITALASLGLLGLLVPRELGGRGGDHVTAAMVVETIARYGCPSAAMVYVMHLGAISTLLYRHHGNKTITSLLSRLDNENLIGTLVFSDPATGGHNWMPMCSKAQRLDDGRLHVLRYGAWATSAGNADFYVIEGKSPDCKGDLMNSSIYLFMKDEVRGSADDWSALGMHGNHAGPVVSEAKLTADRIVGALGEFPLSAHEVLDPYFLFLVASCWNGVAMACIDVAKRHVTTKQHADISKYIADYPIIQDYIGEAVVETNASRMLLFSVTQGMDQVTNGNDWGIHSNDASYVPRRGLFHHWCFQVKVKAADACALVSEKMLHACGGAGYKTDLGFERLYRDSKAGWLMGASNEVLRQTIGKTALFGMQAFDLWEKTPDRKSITREVRKLTSAEKKEFALKLLQEVEVEENTDNQTANYQDTEFDNPFNTAPALAKAPTTDAEGTAHKIVLNQDTYTPLTLQAITPLWGRVCEYKFSLPQPTDQTGCFAGQYVKVKVSANGPESMQYERSMSPVSPTTQYGHVTVVLKHESHGPLSVWFNTLQQGDVVEFKGPCGGYEYTPNTVKNLSLLASGIGSTPAVQIIREIAKNPDDDTLVSGLFYADREAEILYKDELLSYQKQNSRIKVQCTIGEIDNADWKGGEGYISKEMIISTLPTPQDYHQCQVIICGSLAMVLSSIQSLYDLGVPSEKVFVYGPFGAEQIRTVYGRYAKLSPHTSTSANVLTSHF